MRKEHILMYTINVFKTEQKNKIFLVMLYFVLNIIMNKAEIFAKKNLFVSFIFFYFRRPLEASLAFRLNRRFFCLIESLNKYSAFSDC